MWDFQQNINYYYFTFYFVNIYICLFFLLLVIY
jgi:hypothetical protein